MTHPTPTNGGGERQYEIGINRKAELILMQNGVVIVIGTREANAWINDALALARGTGGEG